MEASPDFKPCGDPPLEPKEPDPRMMVVCEGCGLDIHIDCADNVGTEITPCFVCYGEYDCMREVAAYYFIQTICPPPVNA